MKKVNIDFAPRGVRRATLRAPRHAWVLALPAFVLAISTIAPTTQYRKAQAENAQRQAVVEQKARAALPPPAPVRAPIPEAQASAVNAAVMQLNLPWRGLHDAIQAATPANVALLALEPDAKKSSVRITAEAKSSDDMIGYVAQLKEVDWFDAVALVRHEINEQDPNRPIRFQVDARWKGLP